MVLIHNWMHALDFCFLFPLSYSIPEHILDWVNWENVFFCVFRTESEPKWTWIVNLLRKHWLIMTKSSVKWEKGRRNAIKIKMMTNIYSLFRVIHPDARYCVHPFFPLSPFSFSPIPPRKCLCVRVWVSVTHYISM